MKHFKKNLKKERRLKNQENIASTKEHSNILVVDPTGMEIDKSLEKRIQNNYFKEGQKTRKEHR